MDKATRATLKYLKISGGRQSVIRVFVFSKHDTRMTVQYETCLHI